MGTTMVLVMWMVDLTMTVDNWVVVSAEMIWMDKMKDTRWALLIRFRCSPTLSS
jgi:hypothetical protein